MESKEGRKTSINDGLPEILKMKYRIPEPGTTISGFLPIVKKKKNNLMPTDPRFFGHVTINTHIYIFGLTVT